MLIIFLSSRWVNLVLNSLWLITGFVCFTLVSLLASNFVYGIPPPPEEMQKIKQEYSEKLSKIRAMSDKPSPHKQIEDRILPEDVLCSDDHVLMLKWTDVKTACVFPETSKKLVQRGWGVIREEFNVKPRGGCSDILYVYFEDEKHNHSKIIKTIRSYLQEIDPDKKLWYPINLDHDMDEDFIVMTPDHGEFVVEKLRQIENVQSVEYHGKICA